MAANKRELTEAEFEGIDDDLQSDEIESSLPSEEKIVKKYNEGQAQIIIQRNDFLIPNILQMVENHNVLNLSPSYQRRLRWNDSKRSQLIESLLMNIPIPPIFLYEIDLATYEVMDGQQRLDTVRAFFKNEFCLSGLREWSELNDRCYKDLPDRIQKGLQRRGLAAVIVLTESGANKKLSFEIRQYVFERLNTGGEKLNPQEVRNCIYASPFNKMLIRIARNSRFTTAWAIPPKEPDEPKKISEKLKKNPLYSKMQDCEIVLRYFTLREMNKFSGGMKNSLDACMVRNENLKATECRILEAEYNDNLEIAQTVFGQNLFRLPSHNGSLTGRRSVPLADAILLGIRNCGSKSEALVKKADQIQTSTKRLLANPAHYEILVGRGNTKTAIEKRIGLMFRLFSRALKS